MKNNLNCIDLPELKIQCEIKIKNAWEPCITVAYVDDFGEIKVVCQLSFGFAISGDPLDFRPRQNNTESKVVYISQYIKTKEINHEHI